MIVELVVDCTLIFEQPMYVACTTLYELHANKTCAIIGIRSAGTIDRVTMNENIMQIQYKSNRH